MKQDSAHEYEQEHGILWRISHFLADLKPHHEPPADPQWLSWRTEQKRKQRTGEAIVELLRAPANIKAVQAKRVCTPGPDVIRFEDWQRAHTGSVPQLPPPRDTGAIQPVQHDNSTQYTLLPDRFRSSGLPRMLPEVRQSVLSKFGTRPSKPLENGPVPVQNTGEIVKEDRFVAIGPLFEPMDKVPTSRPLTESERASMRDATDSIFELPAQPGSNTWEEFEALASKSGLLPIVETEFPTVETPAIVAKRQAERAAARRERYQLPDLEQRESE